MRFSAQEAKIERIFQQIALGNNQKLAELMMISKEDIQIVFEKQERQGFQNLVGEGAYMMRHIIGV